MLERSFTRQNILIFPANGNITYLKGSFCCIRYQQSLLRIQPAYQQNDLHL